MGFTRCAEHHVVDCAAAGGEYRRNARSPGHAERRGPGARINYGAGPATTSSASRATTPMSARWSPATSPTSFESTAALQAATARTT